MKIGDFGLVRSGLCGFGREHIKGKYCGTPKYMPHMDYRNVPGGGVRYSPKMHDVYSFGLLVWEMYTRTSPYSEFAQDSTMQRHVGEKGHLPLVSSSSSVKMFTSKGIPSSQAWPDKIAMTWVQWPEKLKVLLEDCWASDFSKRPSFEKILNLTLGRSTSSTICGCC